MNVINMMNTLSRPGDFFLKPISGIICIGTVAPLEQQTQHAPAIKYSTSNMMSLKQTIIY